MSNTEEVKIQAESLLKILEETKRDGIVKRFYDVSKTKVIQTIRDMQTLYKYDQSLYMNKSIAKFLILTVLGNTDDYDSFVKILNDKYNDDTLIEDDVFCFAAQQHLVDLADSNGDENEIFEIKRFLIRHTMYAEALEGSPYDLALTDIENKLAEDPKYFGEDVFNPTFRPTGLRAFKGGVIPTSSNSILSVPTEPEDLDLIDEKYIDCEFSPQESKSYQKPKLYKGCLFVSKYKTIKEIFTVENFDEHIITDTSGNAHEIKDCYPIFITEKPEVGDIAFVSKRTKFYMIANKDVLKTIKDSGFGATYYTLKYNNRKIEVLKVKRFSCGALDKDISEVPYHVNIEYIDQDLTYDVKKIADHYNIATTRIIAKEKELIEEIKETLDHPLNIQKSEWLMLVADAGAGKTQISIEYANQKNTDYILQQGHAQLTVDDLLGYKSITDGTYFPSLLRDAVENGKIFILDEIDACNPNTLLALNSLKNKRFQFPDKIVDIHPDFRLIATANTLEYSDVYNGRSKLDKATITRFKIIKCDLEPHHLAIRYGLDYVKDIQNIDRLTPREIERIVVEKKIAEEKNGKTEDLSA